MLEEVWWPNRLRCNGKSTIVVYYWSNWATLMSRSTGERWRSCSTSKQMVKWKPSTYVNAFYNKRRSAEHGRRACSRKCARRMRSPLVSCTRLVKSLWIVCCKLRKLCTDLLSEVVALLSCTSRGCNNYFYYARDTSRIFASRNHNTSSTDEHVLPHNYNNVSRLLLLLLLLLVFAVDELLRWLGAIAFTDVGVILPTSRTNNTALRNGSLLVADSLYSICNYM